MIITYPPMNGPYVTEDNDDNEYITDYSIGRNVIYAAFSRSLAEQAYEKMKSLAEKHCVGFYDASADDGDILFPDNNGKNIPIDRPGNLSSIQQIRNYQVPGKENMSVKEILFTKIKIDQASSNDAPKERNKRSWWKRILGLK